MVYKSIAQAEVQQMAIEDHKTLRQIGIKRRGIRTEGPLILITISSNRENSSWHKESNS